jgi:CheY-like chemotaxis protein
MEPYILIVEDDKDLREILCESLQIEGFEVVAVEHGEAALRHLGTGARPSVILLDLMMPIMDGWTFRERLLGDRALAKIPVIVMTAAGGQRAATVPCSSGTLYKPLEIDSVVNALEPYCPREGP